MAPFLALLLKHNLRQLEARCTSSSAVSPATYACAQPYRGVAAMDSCFVLEEFISIAYSTHSLQYKQSLHIISLHCIPVAVTSKVVPRSGEFPQITRS